MAIFSLIQTKGGCGKSVLAGCLAYSRTFSRTFKQILLLELDAQGTLSIWHAPRTHRQPPDKVIFLQVLDTNARSLTDKLSRLANSYDCIVLDTPGESTVGFSSTLAAGLSDVVLIPSRVSGFDEDAIAAHLLPLVAESDAPCAIVPTFLHPLANQKAVTEYFRRILPDEEGFGCVDACITRRSAYEHFSRERLTLREYAESVKGNARLYEQTRRAVNDIERLAREVIRHANT